MAYLGSKPGVPGCHLAKTARNHGIFGSGNLGGSQEPSGPLYRVRPLKTRYFGCPMENGYLNFRESGFPGESL